MKAYRIPLLARTINLSGRHYGFNEKLISFKDVGFSASYSKAEDLSKLFTHQVIFTLVMTDCVIVANSREEALAIFHDKWEGAQIGGEERKKK